MVYLRKYIDPEPTHGAWGNEEEHSLLEVVTYPTQVNGAEVLLTGEITNIGEGEVVDERGFEWGAEPGVYTEEWTETGTFGTGIFTHATSFPPGTYYYRAKAHDSHGWSYGEEGVFTVTGWLGGWKYRKWHIISSQTESLLTDYQMKLIVHLGTGTDIEDTVYLNNHGKGDFGDLRFTSNDGVTLLPYWIEKVEGTTATVWVKIPRILPHGVEEGSWFIDGHLFNHRIGFEITSGSDELINYPVAITVNTKSLVDSGLATVTGEGVRWVDTDGNLLPFWRQNSFNSEHTTYWVKIPFLAAESTKRVYMYFDKDLPFLAGEGNAEEVFLFFDDFVGDTLNSTKWATNTNTYSVGNGYIKLWGDWNQNWYYLNSKQSFATPFVVIGRWKIGQVNSDTDLSVTFQQNLDGVLFKTGFTCVYDGESSGTSYGVKRICKGSSVLTSDGVVPTTNWCNFKVSFGSDQIIFWDSQLGDLTATTTISGEYHLGIGGDTDSSSRFGYIDWIALYPYVEHEPTVTMLDAESAKIFLYYGNSEATTTSSGDDTFILFDDFSSSQLDQNKWDTSIAGSYSLEEGALKMWGDWNGKGIFSKTFIGDLRNMFAVEWCGRLSAFGDTDLAVFITPDKSPFATGNMIDTGVDSAGGSKWYAQKYIRYIVSGSVDATGYGAFSTTEWQRLRSIFTSSKTKFWDSFFSREDEKQYSVSWTTVYLGLAGDTDSSERFDFLDWVAVRKYSFPEPQNKDWGLEEQYEKAIPLLSDPPAYARFDPEATVAFSWVFNDTQSAYQFQLDNSDFSSPIIDTGKVTSSVTSTTQTLPSTVGLYYWRVRVWDENDMVSDWSEARPIIVDRIKTASIGVPEITDGLVLYLPFEEGKDSTAFDLSGNNNDGMIYGAGWVDGKYGKALNFDGNSYVNTTDINDIELHDVTFSFWIKVNDLTRDLDIITKGAHTTNKPLIIWRDEVVGTPADLGAGNTDTISVLTYDGSVQHWVAAPSGTLNDTKWHHFTIVIDPTNNLIKIYKDGVQVASNTKTWNGIQPTTTLVKIGDATPSQYPFNGIIDEVRIYNRALTPEEIQRLYRI
ncbi:MAG: DUF2341 domain-containing protein, partial [Candidatus Heimdallarchaeota archaeon]